MVGQNINKALLVDDSKLSRKIQRKLLEDLGVESILEAKDGQEALNRLEESEFNVDLVLTDWNMPVMDGLAFIRELRRRESSREGQKVPVIFVTSEGDRGKVHLAFKEGADSYVTKPFRKEVLARKIRHVQNVQSLSQKSSTDASISGDVRVFGFAELVHFLNFTGKSGTLRINNSSGKAEIGFLQGEIQNAKYGELSGEKAFYDIARKQEGEFQFIETESVGDKQIHGSTISLLMEAMRLIDEGEASS